MDNDFVYADKFAQDCAEAKVNPELATYIDKVNRTRVILDLIEVAIKRGTLKIVVSGKHGLVERAIEGSERGLAARDFRLKRSTAEAWFALDDDNSVIAAAPETPKQRRARWLECYEGMGGERGAVKAVYERELKINPKADRSHIGKEILKAKKEKAEAVRGGLLFGQLVRDGKSKG